MNEAREARALVDAVARRFRPAGVFAERFARGKLRHDPVYLDLLRRGVIPDRARVLDLGCGQALLLCLLVESTALARAGRWPASWPPPPAQLQLRGIERAASDVRRARIALAAEGEIEQRDVRTAPLAQSDLIALLDVVHYLEPDSQDHLLGRVANALSPGGVLLLRVCDAAAGFSALLTRMTDRLGSLSRGRMVGRLYSRSATEWIAALERLGLSASAEPASAGTPFANVLITARKAS